MGPYPLPNPLWVGNLAGVLKDWKGQGAAAPWPFPRAGPSFSLQSQGHNRFHYFTVLT